VHNCQESISICTRCYREALKRKLDMEKGRKTRHEMLNTPMMFSYENTHLPFTFKDDSAIYHLNMVEESLISLVSALVIIQKTDGMLY